MALGCAMATTALMFASSGVSAVAGEVSSAATLSPVPARTAASSATASVPAGSGFTSIFTPTLSLPLPVMAHSAKQAGAFAALNALVDTETRFGDAVIGMRVSLDRAQAAAAGAQLGFVRQTNASAEYALAASRLLARFPALQATMVQAFVTDNMSLTLTPAQFAAAKAKLLHGVPASVHSLLEAAAAAYQPAPWPAVGR